MAVNNPRWPHHVTVSRWENTGTDAEPIMTPTLVLDSECRNYLSSKGGENSGVVISKWTVSYPVENAADVRPGDSITIVDRFRIVVSTVVEAIPNNLGCNIYYEDPKN